MPILGRYRWSIKKSGGTIIQAKFSLNEKHVVFLNQYKKYGFKDKSSVIRTAINKLEKQLEILKLKQSADLYSEIYAEDDELRDITEDAIDGWPKWRF